MIRFVILSDGKNLSVASIEERFFASLRMTAFLGFPKLRSPCAKGKARAVNSLRNLNFKFEISNLKSQISNLKSESQIMGAVFISDFSCADHGRSFLMARAGPERLAAWGRHRAAIRPGGAGRRCPRWPESAGLDWWCGMCVGLQWRDRSWSRRCRDRRLRSRRRRGAAAPGGCGRALRRLLPRP